MSEKEEKYELIKQPSVSMFLNEERFEFAQRIGKMLAASTMIPEQFRNNLGNCLIALNLAERLGVDVFGLMQTSYVVHGRPGFEAKLLIALFNSRTQLFVPPLRWEFKGDFPRGKDAACRAYAVDKETKEPLYGEWIDWPLVQGEGWDKKQGSKWLTIPGQMFRYRSASFFINVYEPGLKMGIQTVDEIEDMIIDVTPEPKRTLKIEGETPPETPEDPYRVQDSPQGKEDAPGPESDKVEIPTGPPEKPKRGRPAKEKAPEPLSQGATPGVADATNRVASPQTAGAGQGDEEPPPFDPPEEPKGEEPTPRELFNDLIQEIGLPTTIRILRNGFDIKRPEDVTDKQLSMVIDRLLVEKEKKAE